MSHLLHPHLIGQGDEMASVLFVNFFQSVLPIVAQARLRDGDDALGSTVTPTEIAVEARAIARAAMEALGFEKVWKDEQCKTP